MKKIVHKLSASLNLCDVTLRGIANYYWQNVTCKKCLAKRKVK